MKLLHTSDLHFGLYLFGKSLLEFQQRLPDIIAGCAVSEGADCIIISGDIYNTKDPAGESVKAFDSFVKSLFSACHVPVIIISGNHDYAPRLSVHSSLLETCGLHIRGSLSDYLRPVEIKDAQVYCLPYFTVSEVRALAETDSSGEEHHIETQTEAFAYLTKHIKESWDNGKSHILAAHCFAAGGSVSESERASKSAMSPRLAGGAQLVSADVFSGFDYVALGHLHSPQTISCPDVKTTVRYSGTPLPYSFSEGEREKSLSVYDTAARALKCVPVEGILSLKTISGTLDEITAAASDDIPENEFVRLIFTDRPSAAGLSEMIKELYPNRLVVDCRPDVTEQSGLSSVTAEQVRSMSVEDLAQRFMTEYHKREFTDEMRMWLAEAVSASGADSGGSDSENDTETVFADVGEDGVPI